MKLYVPEPLIADDEGFSSQADIFRRKDFGVRLTNLVENCQDGMVMALDAQWGEGKSTFIKMWCGHIAHHHERSIKSIYFDSFANDFQKDPFLALASQLYELVTDKPQQVKERFKEKAGNVAKSLARGAIKIGVRTISGGLLDESMLDTSKTDISTLMEDQIDILIADKLQNTKTDRLAIKQFRDYLEEFAASHGNGSPIVFIIDELDRCRPDFALELLEQIKHLFSVKNIVFLLILNRTSLEETIRARYGTNIDATQYLQKFISLWLTLPRKNDVHENHGELYIEHSLQKMLDSGETYENHEAINLLSEISRYKKLSCREIERILSYIALIHNMTPSRNLYQHYQLATTFICYLKVTKPSLIEQISRNSITGRQLLEEAGHFGDINKDEYSYIPSLNGLIEYDLADEEAKSKMVELRDQLADSFRRAPVNVLKSVAGWLTNISDR